MIPWDVFRATGFAILLALPLLIVVRNKKNRTLTWTSAVLLGSWLTAIAVVLIGDVPSRLLYWFDQVHAPLAERYSWLRWWEEDLGGNPGYQLVGDLVANTVQGIFFVIICAATYFWGERHKKEGKFKS